jgi:hypothetical protein
VHVDVLEVHRDASSFLTPRLSSIFRIDFGIAAAHPAALNGSHLEFERFHAAETGSSATKLDAETAKSHQANRKTCSGTPSRIHARKEKGGKASGCVSGLVT